MKEIWQALQDAFPVLKTHPILMARIFFALLVLGAFYTAKGWRKKAIGGLHSKIYRKVIDGQRWLYVYRPSSMLNDWKYYTSESTGGSTGDDIIWTLVRWPSFKPIDSFRIAGAVGMLVAIHEAQAKLEGRWQIVHDPDQDIIGPIHAHGLGSRLRRACASVLLFLARV
jgi:hypothetical protein